MEEKIAFYYTNDLHSNFENWPKVMEYIKEQRYKKEKLHYSVFQFDIGDHVDRVSPIAEAFLGKANVELLNEAQFDCATIGNNEGITLPSDDFFHLYDQAKFQVVCGNLHTTSGEDPDWLKPYTTFTSKGGVTIGVIGLTAPFNLFYEHLGWKAENPHIALERLIDEVSTKSDIIVFLSHLGINEDEAIARKFPQIDIIIGGHTHHILKEGEHIENSLLTAAGKQGKFVGEVMVTWDHSQNKVTKKEAYAIDVEHLHGDQATVKMLQDLEQQANTIMNEPISIISKPLEVNWFEETPIIKQLTETMCSWTKADCAMLNAGVLLESLPAGKITRGDIHRICPHPMNPCNVKLSGEELLEVIRGVNTSRFINLQLKGFGFRGKILGKMIFANIDVETYKDTNGEEHIKNVSIKGKPLEKQQEYVLAIPDTFTFGKLLPTVAQSKYKEYFLPEFLRDLLRKVIDEEF